MPRRNNRIPQIPRPLTVSNCRSKQAFANEKLALSAAELRELTDMNLELDVYRCPTCLAWHLTSKPDTLETNKRRKK